MPFIAEGLQRGLGHLRRRALNPEPAVDHRKDQTTVWIE